MCCTGQSCLLGQPHQDPACDRVELADVAEGEGPQERPQCRGRRPSSRWRPRGAVTSAFLNTRLFAPWRSSAMSSLLSAHATIPETSEANYDPGSRPCRWAHSGAPESARGAPRSGPEPGAEPELNTAEVARGVWQSCIAEMPGVRENGTLKKSDFPPRKGVTSRRAHTTHPIIWSRVGPPTATFGVTRAGPAGMREHVACSR